MGVRKLKAVRREDVLTTTSQRSGAQWLLETFLRRFRTLSHIVFMFPVVLLCGLCLGVAAGQGVFVYQTFSSLSADWPAYLRYMALGCGFAFGYVTFGLTLLFLVPAVNFLLPLKLKPFRGPWFSLSTVPWYTHNALTYIVRYSFLEFVTPSPLNIMFYRMMGMKIGKGVMINTTNISDPCLITLEDHVVIGGSATLVAHYGQRGFLVIEPVVIRKGANVGLKASVMGGAELGEGCLVKPHAVVLPKGRVKAGETFES